MVTSSDPSFDFVLCLSPEELPSPKLRDSGHVHLRTSIAFIVALTEGIATPRKDLLGMRECFELFSAFGTFPRPKGEASPLDWPSALARVCSSCKKYRTRDMGHSFGTPCDPTKHDPTRTRQ